MMYFLLTVLSAVSLFFIGWRREKNGREGNTMMVLIISIVVFFLLWLINYFGMPVLNFWGFHGIWIEITFVTLLGAILSHFSVDGSYSRDEVYAPFVVRWVPVIVVAVIGIYAFCSTTAIGRSDKYQQMLQVEVVADSTFNNEVHPIPVEKMRSVDAEYAKKVADDRLGEQPGLASRVYVGKMTIQNITGSFTIDGGKRLTFDNDLIWVAPLEHVSFRKWLINYVTPGYVIVEATDYRKVYLVTNVNGKDLKMRYVESGCFSDDIERHIKNNGFASRGITDHCLEIDFDGRPYWVLASYEKTIGFGGSDSKGIITVDAQTGELNEYKINEAPEWIDRIQPEEFITSQIKFWGIYKHGWVNSWWDEVDVETATPGMSIVYSEGRSYWYTGIKSSQADEGTSGFMLVDTKTKAAKLYRMAGVNEQKVMSIAQDQPVAKAAGYTATNPILYNVRGVPTYFVTLKSGSGNVTGYCFIAVNNRQAVGYGSSKTEAEKEYVRMLMQTERDQIKDGPVTKTSIKEYTVRAITLEGEVYFVLLEELPGKEFYGSSQFFPELKWTKKNDKVSVSFGMGDSSQIPFEIFDNVGFEI